VIDGKKELLAIHLGMRLLNSHNRAYMVCEKEPRPLEESPVKETRAPRAPGEVKVAKAHEHRADEVAAIIVTDRGSEHMHLIVALMWRLLAHRSSVLSAT